MAAIEKVDELTGEYPSWRMHGYKRNHIQICPWNRKQFKGKDHVLVISKAELRIDYGGAYSTLDKMSIDPDVGYYHYTTIKSNVITTKYGSKWKGPGYYEWTRKRSFPSQYLTRKQRVVQSYEYDLYVPDLSGEVNGHYHNHSMDISSVKRRLKRMLGVKKLNIIEVDCRYETEYGNIYADTDKMRTIAEAYFRTKS